jgi:hypothetical protein
VTGYIARYNAQWEQAAKSLRALMSSARGTTVPNAKNPLNDPLVDLLEIFNSTTPASCAAAGGYWREEECKQP